MPQLNPFEASRFLLDLVPRLLAAPTLDVRVAPGGGRSVASVADERLASLRCFLTELVGRVEPVVLSLTGPVTVHLGLLSDGVDRDRAIELAGDVVADAGRRLLDLAAQVLPGTPILLFLEEPGLANSMHPTFPLAGDEIERLVGGVVGPLAQEAMVGVQVNGRADWAMLLRTGIGVLGAPVSARLDTAAAELARFLESGGFIAWGAVPVDEPLGSSSERLWKRLSAMWSELARLGLDPMLIREHSIITPAAGVGDFGVSQAERILRLTSDLSERVFNQVIGARLSIGA